MGKLLYFALAVTAVASSSSAPSIPEIRLTPAEVLSGGRKMQRGSSEPQHLVGLNRHLWGSQQ